MNFSLNKLNKTFFFLASLLLTLSCSEEISKSSKDCSEGIYLPFQEKEGGRWGFVNFSGEEVLPPEFKEVPTVAIEGISMLTEYHDGNKYYDFIKINKSGEKFKVDELGMKLIDGLQFSEGKTAIVTENSKIKYINSEFKELFTLNDIEFACSFSNGLASVQNVDGQWGFINEKGEITIKCQYARVSKFNDKHAIVFESDMYGDYAKLIDTEGKIVADLKDKFVGFGLPSEGKVAVYDGVGWGFYNYKGEKVISINSSWSSVTNFKNGYASFKKEGDWGVIDNKGEVVVRSRYDNPLVFDNGMAPFIEDQMVGFIDVEGTKVIRPTFNEIAYGFGCKNAIVRDGKYFIFIDKEGKQVNKNECRELVQDKNYQDYRRSRYMYTKFNNFIAENQLIQNTIQSQFFDVENLVNNTVGNISDIQAKSKNISASLNNLGFNEDLESSVNGSGTYFHRKQFKEQGSYMPSNLSYCDVYVYFVNKVKSPVRNEYGYVSRYETNLNDPSNAVKEVKFKLKLKDKAYGKESNVVASIVSDISSLGYEKEENDGSYIFWYDTGHPFAEVNFSSNYVYLTLHFLNDPDVDYNNP